MKSLLLDQTIIVKALTILEAMKMKPSEFITQEMLNRLPALTKSEMTKLVILEQQLKES